MKKQLKRILFLSGLPVLFVSSVFAQDNPKPRSITSDDFIKQRPAAKKPPQRKKSSPKYNYIRQEKNVVRRKSVKTLPRRPTVSAKKAEKIFEIGVTMWKIRPPRESDSGYKFPVSVNNRTQMWTAERVSSDIVFKTGDRVRFAVESSSPGFLYLINSEIYTDGSFGEPIVIFPVSDDEDNSVKPGLLVDVPDRMENPPYFTIETQKNNYAGELVTVIISPTPLSNLKVDKDGKIKNLDRLIELEINADVEIYGIEAGQNGVYTSAEAEAACGSKTRELVRQKSTAGKQKLNANPCGEKTRQLTREEPPPQAIYRVKTQPGLPAVAFIRMRVEK